MTNKAARLYANDAPEPRATRVSIFGALWMSPLKPLMKNFLFITMMIKERIICSRPRPTGLSSNQAGTGQPHITCPMEKYMSTHKKPMEVRSLLMRTGVSWSSRASSSAFSLSD